MPVYRAPRNEADLDGIRISSLGCMQQGRQQLPFQLTSSQETALSEVRAAATPMPGSSAPAESWNLPAGRDSMKHLIMETFAMEIKVLSKGASGSSVHLASKRNVKRTGNYHLVRRDRGVLGPITHLTLHPINDVRFTQRLKRAPGLE